MRRTIFTSASVAGLLVCSLVLSGCGGGSESGKGETPKPATAPTTTAAPAAAPTTTAAPAAPAAGEQGKAEPGKEGDDENAPLLAWADADTDEGAAPLAVQFSADIEGGKAPLKVKWTFGDGTESTETNPKHTYDKPGKYRADLEVNDSGGDSDSDYVEIEVSEKK